MKWSLPARWKAGRQFLAASLCLLTAATWGATTNWSTRVWQSDDGLPNNNIPGLAQTPDGYMWMANGVWLARFDGVHFERFSSRSLLAGLRGRISTLLTSRNGSLWMATDHGLVACLNAGKIEIFSNNVPDAMAQTIVEDDVGAIWVAYYGGTICRIQQGIAKQFTNNQSRLLDDSVVSVTKDGKGRLWFASRGQIGISHEGNLTTLLTLPDAITRLTGARNGGVWICQGSHVSRCDQEGRRTDIGNFDGENPNQLPTAMLEDHDGTLWIGTWDSGLFHYDGVGFESIPTSHQQILSLLEDQEDNIWVGTGGGGLNRVQMRTVMLEGREAGLPFDAVQSVCEDTHGIIWAVTQDGLLSCRTTNGWNTASNILPANKATCIAADHNGGVWIGTQGRGLLYWRDERLSTWYYTNGLVSHNIHALLAATSGDLWIGGNEPDSLQCLRGAQFENIRLPSGGGIIRDFAEDSAGNVWAVPSRQGLLRISGDSASDVIRDYTKSSSAVRALYATPDGSLWIGFSIAGLGRIQNGHFTSFTTDQGLYDDSISQIVADGRGWLWIGADHGIFKVRQKDFDDVAAGRASRVWSIHYGRSAGLGSLQANFGHSPDVLQSHDGRLWLAMRSGLAVVDPDRLRDESKPPPVLLKQVTVDDHVVASYGGVIPVQEGVDLQNGHGVLRLPPSLRRLEFDFTSLNFTAPENVQFRYRLEGYDDKWIEIQGQRSASYSQLPAGNYRFAASACNSDGVWNDTGATLGFTVEPFIWQTWWFRLAASALFTAVMFAVVRLVSVRRVKARVLAEQAALEKSRMAGTAEVATSVLHNVGNVLNSVNVSTTLISDRIKKSRLSNLERAAKLLEEHAVEPGFFTQNPKGQQLPAYMTSLARHLAAEQEEVLREVEALENNVGHIKQIVVRQQNYASTAGTAEICSPTDVVEDALHINASSMEHKGVQIVREFQPVPTVTTDKHKMLQILINLISNAKQAMTAGGEADKRLVVRVEANGGGRVKISVADNGVGISPENQARIFEYGFTTRKDGHGFGLHSSMMAAKELGGSLTFHSDGQGKGAAFILEIPAKGCGN